MHNGLFATEVSDAKPVCIGSQIRQLNRIVTRFYDDRLVAFGFTLAQFETLNCIAGHDGIRATEICEHYDIEKSTLSRNLARLDKAAFISAESRGARYGKVLRATSVGRRCLIEAAPAWKEANQEVLIALAGADDHICTAVGRARTLNRTP